MTAVIDVAGLRKHYPRTWRGVRALDGFDLSVAEGEIHGLLGPNASGKSTVLRALLGLVRADAGRMRIFDREVPRHLPRVLGTVGAVLDEPQFFPDFTARRTLRLLAATAGVKRRRVAEALAQVGLSGNAKERVGSYSRGMRQRLALAAALLKEPQLLILDEPCAGLDPTGISDLRALLRTLADDGVTVLLASHALTEVQWLCDTVTVVARGQRIATGPVADLLASQDKGDVRVRTTDLTAAAKLVADAGLPVEVYDDHMVVSDIADPAWIAEALGRKRLWVSELTPLPPVLDTLYRSLAGVLPTLPGQVDQLAELSGLLDTDTPLEQPVPEPDVAPAPSAPPADIAVPELPEVASEPPAVASQEEMDTGTEATPVDVPALQVVADPPPSDRADADPVPVSAPPMSPVPTGVTAPAAVAEPAAATVVDAPESPPDGTSPEDTSDSAETPASSLATASGREEVRP